MSDQKEHAKKRLPPGFKSWSEFARHGALSRAKKQAEDKELADMMRKKKEGKE